MTQDIIAMNPNDIIQVTPDWMNGQLMVETYEETIAIPLTAFCEFHRKGWDLTGISNFDMVEQALDRNYANFDMNELMAEYFTDLMVKEVVG